LTLYFGRQVYNQMKKIILFTLVMLQLYSGKMVGQDNSSPTIAETVGWLSSKLNRNIYIDSLRNYNHFEITFDSQTKSLTLKKVNYLLVGLSGLYTCSISEQIIPLDKLDPNRVDTLHFKDGFSSIELCTNDTMPIVRAKYTASNGIKVTNISDEHRSWARIIVNESGGKSINDKEQDLLSREQKAFIHLIKLCGGKKSTITLPKVKQKKEAF
jgi:hypothetical protein